MEAKKIWADELYTKIIRARKTTGKYTALLSNIEYYTHYDYTTNMHWW